MLRARHAPRAAWEYVKNNWEMVKELGMGASGLIESAGRLPHSLRNDFVEFCETHVKVLADVGYAQALETMDLMAEFHARTKDDLAAWLSNVRFEGVADASKHS